MPSYSDLGHQRCCLSMTETHSAWHLYMLRMPSGMLYTGITTDVARRLTQHQAGKGAKALRGKGELVLAFHCLVGDRSKALRLEYRVKQLTKMQKERLVSHPPLSLDYLLPDVNVKAG
ncbi:putative endonuclease [Serratia sp. PL17]|nr:putative endonuclease [Serratia sp. PL17]